MIAGGRMAVILGTELQHLFNCDADRPACTRGTSGEGLDRLEAMGVNYVFPIHHKLNQFGGPQPVQPADQRPHRGLLRDDGGLLGHRPHAAGPRSSCEELTARGMLIDTEHLSWKAFDDTLSHRRARRYPVLASHVGPFDLKATGSRPSSCAEDRPATAASWRWAG